MTDLNADELLALGQLAGYTRADVAQMLLDADDRTPITPHSFCGRHSRDHGMSGEL